MNKQASPGVIITIIVVVVVLLALWGYKTLKPSGYQPSPGGAGNPAAGAPNYGQEPSALKNSQGGAPVQNGSPVIPPKGSHPGAPAGYAQPSQSSNH